MTPILLGFAIGFLVSLAVSSLLVNNNRSRRR